MSIQIITFYKFFSIPIDEVSQVEKRLYLMAQDFDKMAGQQNTLRGLLILGTEGANATFSIPQDLATTFKDRIQQTLDVKDVVFKDSFADKHVFHNFKVKVRNEIVSLDRPDLVPNKPHNHHLSPAEWDRVMREEDHVIIDTRNDYEYEIGHFKGAIDPKIEEFNEFPKWVKENPIPKDKKILIYCTGGIRCEKAILEMNEQGYENVYQLDGGILNYLKEKPHQLFEGECFVFDYRIAVDQELRPSTKYKLCPHCGQPAQTKINCIQCGIEETVCEKCVDQGDEFKTCSKNCAHHNRMGHKTTRIHTDAFNRRQIV